MTLPSLQEKDIPGGYREMIALQRVHGTPPCDHTEFAEIMAVLDFGQIVRMGGPVLGVGLYATDRQGKPRQAEVIDTICYDRIHDCGTIVLVFRKILKDELAALWHNDVLLSSKRL